MNLQQKIRKALEGNLDWLGLEDALDEAEKAILRVFIVELEKLPLTQVTQLYDGKTLELEYITKSTVDQLIQSLKGERE